MTNDKPMDAAAVVAAAERIVMPERVHHVPLGFGHSAQTVIYIDGRRWNLMFSESPPGTFTYTWVPDASSPE